MKFTIIAIALIVAFGCQGVPNKSRGGYASFGGVSAEPVSLAQPENPENSSKQNVEFESSETVETTKDSVITTTVKHPDGSEETTTKTVPAGTKTVRVTKQSVTQEISGSWKDKAAELAAKLGSFKPVQYFGMLLIVASLAMFHPLVRAAIGGGKEIQWGAAAVGATLIFLPSFIVGQEKLIIIAAVVLLGGAYLLTRLSYYKGKSDVKND